MRFILHLLLAGLIALGVGFGLSWYALTDGRLIGATQIGPWTAWEAAGSSNPDPYTRAYLARGGRLQLGRSEGLRFVAEHDSSGGRLRRSCTYQVTGQTPQASLWTLVALDRLGRNIARAGTPLYMDSTHMVRDKDGAVAVAVSAKLSSGDWLEISGSGTFDLVLTLYDGAAYSGPSAGTMILPRIVNRGCV